MLNPQKIYDSLEDSYWIIANMKHVEDIRKQLSQFGVEKDKILVCPGYDILRRMVPKRLIKEEQR